MDIYCRNDKFATIALELQENSRCCCVRAQGLGGQEAISGPISSHPGWQTGNITSSIHQNTMILSGCEYGEVTLWMDPLNTDNQGESKTFTAHKAKIHEILNENFSLAL